MKPGDWPDIVAVLTEDGSLCSGTLIAPDLVLTAAHCIGGKPAEVILDTVDLAKSGGERVAVKWSKAYPKWESQYDVGLVMLDHAVAEMPRAFATGCGASHARLVRGAKLTVAGFGLTTRSAMDNNTKLHAASIGVVDGACASDPSCNTAIAPGGEFTAGGQGTDACFGDSGGPVYIATAGGPALIGVVSRGLASFGDPCGDGGVFVRADQVIDWIESVSGRKVDTVACDVPADDGTTGGEAGDGAELPAGGCSAGGQAVGGLVGVLLLAFAVATLRLARLARLRGGTTRRPA